MIRVVTVYIQYVDDHHLKRLEQNDEDKPSRAEPSGRSREFLL